MQRSSLLPPSLPSRCPSFYDPFSLSLSLSSSLSFSLHAPDPPSIFSLIPQSAGHPPPSPLLPPSVLRSSNSPLSAALPSINDPEAKVKSGVIVGQNGMGQRTTRPRPPLKKGTNPMLFACSCRWKSDFLLRQDMLMSWKLIEAISVLLFEDFNIQCMYSIRCMYGVSILLPKIYD